MKRSKLIASLIAVLAIVSVVFVVLQLVNSSKSTNPTPVTLASGGVTITNSANYSMNQGIISAVQNDLQAFVKLNGGSTKNTHSAIIRDGSFTKHNSRDISTGLPVSEYIFLVDLPDVKQSYSIDVVKMQNREQPLLNILCPPPDQLKYGDFKCHEI